MVILDATPLIYLATADRLELLEHTDDQPVVPQAVYHEVGTTGLEAGHPDARRVEQAVERGLLTVQPVDGSGLADRLRDNSNVSEADIAVIALAAEEDDVAVMDDRYARSTAKTEGVDTIGTVAVILNAVQAGELAPEEAIDVVDTMIDAGWYCSTALYTRIVRTIRSLSDRGDAR